jgi:hypothetical protein
MTTEPLSPHLPAPVQRLGSAVLLQGSVVRDAAYLVAVGIRALKARDGIGPTPTWLELHRELKTAAGVSSANGTGSRVGAADLASLSAEVIGTAEAAGLLGVTERQMRKLASRFGGARAGRVHLFDRDAIEAEAHRRDEERRRDRPGSAA